MLAETDVHRIAVDLAAVPGVVAVALGGSRARGTHRPDSDVDLGVYVTADLDRDQLSSVASRWSESGVTVGDAGTWGPWVDSGAWLSVDGTSVDIIVRDLDRVTEQCARAQRGEFAFHRQAGHPFGFLDVSYAGEVALGVPLVDDARVLQRLAQSVDPYPPALRRSLVADLWQVDFLLDGAEKAAKSRDAGYVALCIAPAVTLLAHGWHASCGQWVVNEKGVIPAVSRLPGGPPAFSADAATVLGSLGTMTNELLASIDRARVLPRPDPEPGKSE